MAQLQQEISSIRIPMCDGFQYRKRYVRVATDGYAKDLRKQLFQYRKRYVRVATIKTLAIAELIKSFNTASGMYALQQRVWKPAPRQG